MTTSSLPGLDAVEREKKVRRFSRLTLLALPLLLFLALFFIWPIIGLLKQGFYSHGVLSIDNYRRLLDVPIYRIVLQNTFVIAAVVTVSCIVMSYPLAYLMASVKPALSKLLFFAVLLPFWSSALVRTSAWIALLQQNGPLNTLLVTTRLIDQPVAFLYNFTGVLIGMTHVLMPFCGIAAVLLVSLDGQIPDSGGAESGRGFHRHFHPGDFTADPSGRGGGGHYRLHECGGVLHYAIADGRTGAAHDCRTHLA